MSTDAGGTTTIATARNAPQIPSVSRGCLKIPDITSAFGTFIVRLFTAAGKDWFLARVLCLYYYYPAYTAFLCPDQKGK